VVGRAEIARLEPRLRAAEIPEHAVYAPTDAGVDPAELTSALTRAAQGMGARVICGADVRSVEVSQGSTRGVVSSAGFHPADTVVLTAGADTAAFPFGVRVAASPACSLRIAAPPGAVRTILVGADFEVREVSDGQLVATIPYAGEAEPADAQSLGRLVQRRFARIQAAFEGGDGFRLLGYGVAERPVPADGPIVGYVTPDQSVYVAVMHSGVTLAPTVGRLVAAELVGRRQR
jgi:glycine/D-amino acid oxidase-like deaminating enzyme